MKQPDRPLTLRDVAKAAGVSPMTASYALRDHPACAAATRVRVKAVAEQIGYRADPLLAALVARRTGSAAIRGTLGMIFDRPKAYWTAAPFDRAVLAGIDRRAGELGYRVERFELGGSGFSGDRLTTILLSRGIRGVIIGPPQQAGARLEMDWSPFSGIVIGRAVRHPAFDFVSANQYQAGLHVFQTLYERGYRRIGFASPFSVDERIRHRFLAAYFVVANEWAGSPAAIPPLLECGDHLNRIRAWIQDHQLDAVVADDSQFIDVLRKLGYWLPRDLGFATTILPDPATGVAGVVPQFEMIGESVVSFLHGKLLSGATGIPSTRIGSIVDGVWNEGTTLRG